MAIVASGSGLLTTTGLNEKQANGKTNFLYLAVGTGTTTPTESDTALEAELDRVSIGAITAVDNILTYQAFYNTGDANDDAVSEFGIFDAASGGNLLLRGLFDTAFAKTVADPMIVSVTDTLTNAA